VWLAIGGFNGSGPVPSLAKFKQLVAQHKIHYFVGGTGTASAAAPATARRSPRG
jgi:hypothetical protein